MKNRFLLIGCFCLGTIGSRSTLSMERSSDVLLDLPLSFVEACRSLMPYSAPFSSFITPSLYENVYFVDSKKLATEEFKNTTLTIKAIITLANLYKSNDKNNTDWKNEVQKFYKLETADFIKYTLSLIDYLSLQPDSSQYIEDQQAIIDQLTTLMNWKSCIESINLCISLSKGFLNNLCNPKDLHRGWKVAGYGTLVAGSLTSIVSPQSSFAASYGAYLILAAIRYQLLSKTERSKLLLHLCSSGNFITTPAFYWAFTTLLTQSVNKTLQHFSFFKRNKVIPKYFVTSLVTLFCISQLVRDYRCYSKIFRKQDK